MDILLTTLSDEILQHAHSNLQEEVCGLIGHRDGELRYFPCTNIHSRPAHNFEIAPTEIWPILDEGWQLKFVVHSHPFGHKMPSGIDVQKFPLHYVKFGYIVVLGQESQIVLYNHTGIITTVRST